MPRLSVVVPFYNVADYIADCLDSLARQTFEDLEVILVDDGSRDDSVHVAREFAQRDPRFRIVTQENQGLGPARNTGVVHATGEYITFVDSDDIVPRYAYELMVRSLDETGSSFAAGGARRFSNSSGVRPSYLHQIPFAKDRLTTHVLEYPELALDRMVWNKVYRRSFWDEFKFEFPPIRYEDYPVTLKAHLDAVTVDSLSSPVYYWRERESGESITQYKFEYTNLYDRVLSAEMVMDLVDRRAPMLRTTVHSHFAKIDLAALVQAFPSTPDDRLADLVELGRRLTSRLDPAVLAKGSRYDRLQFRALHTGEVDLLRRLAQFQIDGGVRGGVRARKHPLMRWRYENEYPGLTDRNRVIPRSLYRLPYAALELLSSVTRVWWTDMSVIIRGTAEIRHLRTTDDSTLKISLVHGRTRTAIPFKRFETLDKHGELALVGFEARVPRALLGALKHNGSSVRFALSLTSSGVHRSEDLRGAIQGNPVMAEGSWITDRMWIQPGPVKGGWFALRQHVDPWQITAVEFVDESMVVQVHLPEGEHPEPKLTLSRHSRNDIVVDLQPLSDTGDGQFVAAIPLDDLVDPDNPDDPFTMATVRVMYVVSGEEKRLLFAAALRHSVSHVHRKRLLTVTRSAGNYTHLVESPVRLMADETVTDEGPRGLRLRVLGELREGRVDRVIWRRYLDARDTHVDVACDVDVAGGRWSATIDVVDLTSTDPADPQASPLEAGSVWSLYAIPAGGSAYAIYIDAYEVGRMPLEIISESGHLTVEPKAGTFHVEVR